MLDETSGILLAATGLLIFFIGPGFISIHIYQDARRRGRDDAGMWAIKAFTILPGSIQIYLEYRRQVKENQTEE